MRLQKENWRLNTVLFLFRYTTSFKDSSGIWIQERNLLVCTPGQKLRYLFILQLNKSAAARNHRLPYQHRWQKPLPQRGAHIRILGCSPRPDWVFRASPITKQKDILLLFPFTYVTKDRNFLVKISPLDSCQEHTSFTEGQWTDQPQNCKNFPFPTKGCRSSASCWSSACNITLEAFKSLLSISA